MLKKALEEKARMVPKKGYNVVGVDTYELPGEKLFLIGHYQTPEEAEKCKRLFSKEHPDVPVYIYDPTTT